MRPIARDLRIAGEHVQAAAPLGEDDVSRCLVTFGNRQRSYRSGLSTRRDRPTARHAADRSRPASGCGSVARRSGQPDPALQVSPHPFLQRCWRCRINADELPEWTLVDRQRPTTPTQRTNPTGIHAQRHTAPATTSRRRMNQGIDTGPSTSSSSDRGRRAHHALLLKASAR